MIFSKKNAGKWVASKGIAVVASSSNLNVLMKKVERRKDKEKIRFDLVPPHQHFAGHYGISLH